MNKCDLPDDKIKCFAEIISTNQNIDVGLHQLEESNDEEVRFEPQNLLNVSGQ